MKNPSKLYCMTVGSKDYAFRDTVKGASITDHDNKYSPRRNDYTSLVESVPKMSEPVTRTSPSV